MSFLDRSHVSNMTKTNPKYVVDAIARQCHVMLNNCICFIMHNLALPCIYIKRAYFANYCYVCDVTRCHTISAMSHGVCEALELHRLRGHRGLLEIAGHPMHLLSIRRFAYPGLATFLQRYILILKRVYQSSRWFGFALNHYIHVSGVEPNE